MWYLYGMTAMVVIKLINTVIILLRCKSNKTAGEVREYYTSVDNRTYLTVLLPISLLSIVLWPITIIAAPFIVKELICR